MPTSAAGSSAAALAVRRPRAAGRYHFDSCSRNIHGRFRHFLLINPRARGFTLLELLVVLAIMAIATAGVAMALRDGPSAALEREGERLAALLESARAMSRTSGVPVRWRPTASGFVFDGLPPEALPTRWLAEGIGAVPANAAGQALPALLLGPEPIIPAQQVRLTLAGAEGRSVLVATDGVAPFAVVSP